MREYDLIEYEEFEDRFIDEVMPYIEKNMISLAKELLKLEEEISKTTEDSNFNWNWKISSPIFIISCIAFLLIGITYSITTAIWCFIALFFCYIMAYATAYLMHRRIKKIPAYDNLSDERVHSKIIKLLNEYIRNFRIEGKQNLRELDKLKHKISPHIPKDANVSSKSALFKFNIENMEVQFQIKTYQWYKAMSNSENVSYQEDLGLIIFVLDEENPLAKSDFSFSLVKNIFDDVRETDLQFDQFSNYEFSKTFSPMTNNKEKMRKVFSPWVMNKLLEIFEISEIKEFQVNKIDNKIFLSFSPDFQGMMRYDSYDFDSEESLEEYLDDILSDTYIIYKLILFVLNFDI